MKMVQNVFYIILLLTLAVLISQKIRAFEGKSMTVQEFQKEWKTGSGNILIDVREPDEFAGGHAPGAKNIPLGLISKKLDDLKNFRKIYVICQSGGRSALACTTLTPALGKDQEIINIEGGTSAWISAGFPIEK